MEKLVLVSDYKNIEKYRLCFNRLAINTFRIDLETWYQKGFWNDRYICYSLFSGNEILSNVSISIMDLIISGQQRKAIQLGTVMTHPDYRRRGLSKRLINHVLNKYQKECDLFYLFANESVYDFYPKFGFIEAHESKFYSDIFKNNCEKEKLQKLCIDSRSDLKIIKRIVLDSVPISLSFGFRNYSSLLFFHLLNTFKDDIHYLPEKDILIIMKIDKKCLHLFDIFSTKEIKICDFLSSLCPPNIKKVLYHFTPDNSEANISSSLITERDDRLFVKNVTSGLPHKFFIPITVHS